jgi:hypothetical protein
MGADTEDLTATELAAALGISRQRVNELRRQKKISREPNGKYLLPKVTAELRRSLDSSQTCQQQFKRSPLSTE